MASQECLEKVQHLLKAAKARGEDAIDRQIRACIRDELASLLERECDDRSMEAVRQFLARRLLERAVEADYPAGVDDPAIQSELAARNVRYTPAPS